MKKTRSRVWRRLQGALWIIPLLFLTQFAPNLYAQGMAGGATLTGTVVDPSGAVVPTASVSLTNPEKGLELKFATSADGRYSFTFVPPGEGYQLKVEANGFRPYLQTGISLAVGQTASLDVNLQVGQTTAEVMVTSDAPLLATEDANVGSDVNERGIVQLPLSTRNLVSLLSLNSSVQPGANLQQVPGLGSLADQDVSFLNFGGQRFGTTAYLVDGIYDTGGDWGGVIYTPSVEETAEFRVQSNSYSAQYGWSTGNVVNMITKSGTRSIHGDGFWFLRNEALEANNFFNNLHGIPKSEYRQNQFGGTVGGPVYIPGVYKQRDKTFFFFSAERINRTTPVSLTATLPLESWKSGDFSNLLGAQVGTDAEGRPILSGSIYNPFSTRYVTAGQVDTVTGLTPTASGYIRDPFAGNKIPQGLWDPLAKKLVGYWPQAQNQSANVNNFSISGTETAYSMPIDTRIDHNITDNMRIFGKFAWKPVNFNDPPAFFGASNPAGPSNGHPNNRLLGAISFVKVLDPTSTVSANIGIARWVEGRTPQGAGFLPSSLGFSSALDVATNFPQISFQNSNNNIYPLANAANGNGATDRWPRDNRSAGVDYNKVHGSHSLSAGFNYIAVLINDLDGNQATFTFDQAATAGPNPLASTANTGFNFASFLLGTGQGGSGNVPQLTNAAVSRKFIGGYVQDDWKVNRKLTLNLGLRYEVQTSPTERYNQQAWFDYNAPSPISGVTVSGTGQTVAQLLGRPLNGAEVFAGGDNGRGLFGIQKNNFAPRIGLAYAATSKLVVRAGAAIFFVPDFVMPGGGYSAPGFSSNTPWVTTLNDGATPANTLANAFPNGLKQAAGASIGTMADIGFGATEGFTHWRPTPYTEQWSAGLQYELGHNNIIDVEYIGNRGLKLPVNSLNRDQASPETLSKFQGHLFDQVANPFYGVIKSSGCGLDQAKIPLNQLLKPYPQFCGIAESQAEVASSWYNALQVGFQHRWSNGLQLMASFTWSKYLDNSAGVQGWTNWAAESVRNPYNMAAEKSYDTNDIPVAFVTNFVYDLPVGKGRQFGKDLSPVINAVAGGWQVSGILSLHDGFPLSVQDWDTSGTVGAFGGAYRPDLICNPSVSNHTWNNWVNGNCFAQPTTFASYGNAPRTLGNLRGPSYANLDLAIHKNWIFREKLTTEFRAEAFNAMNHTNFFAPGGGALDWGPGSNSSTGFGQITNSYPSRDIQLALKLLW